MSNYTNKFSDEIKKSLEMLMSKQEVQIYIYLLENPNKTVYSISKDLSISRSTLYPLVEGMYNKGILLKVSTDSQSYFPEVPQTLLDKIKYDYVQAFSKLYKGLDSIKPNKQTDYFLNLVGYETNLFKAKELLLSSKKEVYINCDMPLEVFYKELEVLEKQNVKVIVFSFTHQHCHFKNVEIYTHDFPIVNEPTRLMVVSDIKEVLVSGRTSNNNWLGTITNNDLMINVISEHIHHDIYLLKLEKILGRNPFKSGEISINTLIEKNSFLC